MTRQGDPADAARQFQVEGELASVTPYGSGHINDTYRADFHHGDNRQSFILQRINHHVFKNPVALMENIQRVTAHLAKQVAHHPDSLRRVLTLIPARHGRLWHIDVDGNHWRMYRFIHNARSYDRVESPEQAYQAARAFGQFQHQLSTLPAHKLHDTIAGFHHTPRRFEALERAIELDIANRATLVKTEIDFALAHQPITGTLIDANLPERVTHNDTKFGNVLLDDITGEGICVIDLDTVMPGLALYDFGDMVRTTTSPAAEDERDLTLVKMQFPMFEALVRGYLSSAGSFLTNAEKDHLAFSGKLITFEMGLRFLTDYLAGDTYYKIHREAHNLDRCRTQFKLVESIERQEPQMNQLIESIEG